MNENSNCPFPISSELYQIIKDFFDRTDEYVSVYDFDGCYDVPILTYGESPEERELADAFQSENDCKSAEFHCPNFKNNIQSNTLDPSVRTAEETEKILPADFGELGRRFSSVPIATECIMEFSKQVNTESTRSFFKPSSNEQEMTGCFENRSAPVDASFSSFPLRKEQRSKQSDNTLAEPSNSSNQQQNWQTRSISIDQLARETDFPQQDSTCQNQSVNICNSAKIEACLTELKRLNKKIDLLVKQESDTKIEEVRLVIG